MPGLKHCPILGRREVWRDDVDKGSLLLRVEDEKRVKGREYVNEKT